MILAVYLGHGIFRPVVVLSFSPNQFVGGMLSSKIEEPQKNVVHLYRSTRLRLHTDE